MQRKKDNQKKEARRELKLDEFLLEEDGVFDEEDSDRVTDDTLEFLCLDDETIESYQGGRRSTGTGKKASASRYEEDDDDDEYDDEDDEDEDYEDEDEYDDEEDYEDEDYEDDDDEYEEDEDYDDDDAGIIVRFRRFLTDMSTLDMVVAMLGIVVIAGVLVTGVLYANAKSVEKQVEAFASVGEEVEGIAVIGESGLLAVSESARIAAMIDMEEEPEEVEEEVEEPDQKQTIEVALNLTSIQSDLKIKFVNKATGKLIGSVPFEVDVSNGNKSFGLKDEDKDGIIYQTGIDKGTYEVVVKPFGGDDYSEYKLPSSASSIKVTDTIAYKKVDVADEVKSESEINAAIEDTAVQNTVVESTLTDTVEWVESTKTPVGEGTPVYEEVPKKNIPDPWTVSSTYRKLAAEGAEDSGNVTVSLNKDSISLTVGESEKLKVSVTGTDTRYTVEWNSADTSIATVSEGTVTAVGAGSTNITATVAVGSLIQDLSCSVTVSGAQQPDDSNQGDNNDDNNKNDDNKGDDGKDDGKDSGKADGKDDDVKGDDDKNDGNNNQDIVYTKVTISGASEVVVGKTITLTAQTEPKGGKVIWSSDNEKIAKVDSAGVVTGVAEGTANIEARCGGSEVVSATYTITVKKKEKKVDGSAKLKDKDGNQMYYKDASGEYREATYDDYNKRDAFYKKGTQITEYKYTGWQTIDGYVYFFDKDGNYVTGEQVIQGAKYTFGSDGRLSSGSGTMGIDVSKHNGNIDWNAVKNSGVSYVIIRCGYRGSSTGALVEDPKFRSNIKGAKAAGLKVGVYFFSQAVNEVEAVEEASMALSLISGYGLNYPVFLDVEGSGGRADSISRDMRTAVCKAFCATIQNSGYSAGVYANKTWLNEKINAGGLTAYKIWLAQYAAAPTYTTTRYDMWQYSSKGRISGISTNVDMNISYMNY